mmetsp:Transcript_40544/g.125345  ORF Transcript_40544/g.125345 Transcript_40544/m.125345 type:complete len:220 (+) Transcript_40544:514-1173(+)
MALTRVSRLSTSSRRLASAADCWSCCWSCCRSCCWSCGAAPFHQSSHRPSCRTFSFQAVMQRDPSAARIAQSCPSACPGASSAARRRWSRLERAVSCQQECRSASSPPLRSPPRQCPAAARPCTGPSRRRRRRRTLPRRPPPCWDKRSHHPRQTCEACGWCGTLQRSRRCCQTGRCPRPQTRAPRARLTPESACRSHLSATATSTLSRPWTPRPQRRCH